MESRSHEPPPQAPERSERLLTQSTRVLRLARELALSADASTIARLVTRRVGELSGGGPTAVYLLDPEGVPVHAAAAGLHARQPLWPPSPRAPRSASSKNRSFHGTKCAASSSLRRSSRRSNHWEYGATF